MDKATVKKINRISVMPGVDKIDILPNANQIWFKVKGHECTRKVVAVLEKIFNTKSDGYSDNECFKKDNTLYTNIYPEGLIISIHGYAEKAPAVTGAEGNYTLDDFTTEPFEAEGVAL